MNIDDEIKKYFIPSFCQWNFQDCIIFTEHPMFPFSRFLIIDNSIILRLIYHCFNRWSFVKVDKHFKADPSEKLTFVTNTEFTPLLISIYNIHEVSKVWEIDHIKNENLPFLK